MRLFHIYIMIMGTIILFSTLYLKCKLECGRSLRTTISVDPHFGSHTVDCNNYRLITMTDVTIPFNRFNIIVAILIYLI